MHLHRLGELARADGKATIRIRVKKEIQWLTMANVVVIVGSLRKESFTLKHRQRIGQAGAG